MRKSGDQIAAEIAEARVAQNLRGAINIFATMHAAGGGQFAIFKSLDAHADAIEFGVAPSGGAVGRDGLGIGFERDFGQLAGKRFAGGGEKTR